MRRGAKSSVSSLTRCLNEWGFKRRLREAFNPDATFRAAKRIALGSGNDSMSFKAGRPSDSVPFWLPTAYLIGASFAISHASVMRTGMTQIRAAVCCESCQLVSISCCLTLASTPSASRCTNKRSQGNISNAESILVFSPLESGKCAAQFRRIAVSDQQTHIDCAPAAVIGTQADGVCGFQRWGNNSLIMLARCVGRRVRTSLR